jgi:hypothetical protein
MPPPRRQLARPRPGHSQKSVLADDISRIVPLGHPLWVEDFAPALWIYAPALTLKKLCQSAFHPQQLHIAN